MSESTYGIVILFGLGLASVAVRNIAKKSGRELFFYISALVSIGALGALIAHHDGDHTWAFGLVMGMAMVELGDTMLASAKEVVRKLLSKISDRFADDRQPGYGNDEES